MIFRSLSVGASALLAQQKAIDVVSQNIANANTPGYSRQTVELATAHPDFIYGREFGNGVDVVGIRRSIDPILDRALMSSNGNTAYAQTLAAGLKSMEPVFGTLDAPGLTSVIDGFFQALQQLANTPEEAAARMNVRSKAEALTAQVSGMHRQIQAKQQAADQEIRMMIPQINSLMDKIADLNAQILAREAVGQPQASANNLRDQRDAAVMELAKLIPLQKATTSGGGLLLQTPGGDLLIQDGQVRHLSLGSGNNGFAEVVFADTGQKAQGVEQGGRLGGLIALRDKQLGGYLSQLDSLAKNLIFSFNQAHAGGTGTTPVTRYVSGVNAGNAAAPVDVDPNVPFASKIVAGSFRIHVLDAAPPSNPGGYTINITPGVTTLNQVAAAISAIPGVTASVDASGHLVIDGGGNRIAFSNDTSNFLAAYEINTFFHGGSAADIAVDPSILADPGRIATATADAASNIAPADNTAAMAMFSLRDQAISFDGSAPASLIERASMLASTYGLDAAAAEQMLTYREAEASALASQRESVSGVNLDEELVNMIRFQRAYQASAKIIQTSNEMLDTLLGLIR